MDISEEEALHRTRHQNMYFRIVREGIGAPDFRSPKEYNEELERIAMYTKSLALKRACEQAIGRYDEVTALSAANNA